MKEHMSDTGPEGAVLTAKDRGETSPHHKREAPKPFVHKQVRVAVGDLDPDTLHKPSVDNPTRLESETQNPESADSQNSTVEQNHPSPENPQNIPLVFSISNADQFPTRQNGKTLEYLDMNGNVVAVKKNGRITTKDFDPSRSDYLVSKFSIDAGTAVIVDPLTGHEVARRNKDGSISPDEGLFPGEYDPSRKDYIEQKDTLNYIVEKDPITGMEVSWMPTMEGAAGVYSPDMPAGMGIENNYNNAMDFVDSILGPQESTVAPFSPEYMQEFANTLISRLAVGPDMTPDQRAEVIELARARMHLHNLVMVHRRGETSFSAEFAAMSSAEHVRIFRYQGVEDVVKSLIYGLPAGTPLAFPPGTPEGQYFRLTNPQRQAIDAELVNQLQGMYHITQRQAQLALDFGKRELDSWAESSRYDGIRNGPGAGDYQNFANPDGSPNFGAYETYLEENYGDIDLTTGGYDATTGVFADRSSLSGGGMSQLKQAFWWAAALGKPSAPAVPVQFLKRFIDMRVGAASQFNHPSYSGPRENLYEMVYKLRDGAGNPTFLSFTGEFTKYYTWSQRMEGAVKNKNEILPVLIQPLVEPNRMNILPHKEEEANKVIDSVMSVMVESSGKAFSHLSKRDQQLSTKQLLKGIMLYMGPEIELARHEVAGGEGWYQWRETDRLKVIARFVDRGLIDRVDGEDLMREFRIDRNRVAIKDNSGQAVGGMFGVFGKFLKSLGPGK